MFERLGSGIDLKAASPYPDAALFAQDIYPFNPNQPHELTGGVVRSYVEFNAAVYRQLSMTTLYATGAGITDGAHAAGSGVMFGINTLARTSQTIGDAYVDVIEATGAVVADASIWAYQTTANLGSQFFNSFRAQLTCAVGLDKPLSCSLVCSAAQPPTLL